MRWLLLLMTLLLAENSLTKAKTPDAQAQYNQYVASGIGLDLLNNDVYEVSFGDGVAPLRGTGSHPLYSLDRDDWVRVRDLQIGERLQTAEGAVSVEALEKVRGLHRVYNLEVEGDHEYLVGEAGVRAHNTCLFHGTRPENIRGIIEKGFKGPESFFSRLLGDTFQHGGSREAKAAFSLRVRLPGGATTRNAVVPGNPQTVIATGSDVAGTVEAMYIRRRVGDAFETEVVEGVEAILRRLTELGY